MKLNFSDNIYQLQYYYKSYKTSQLTQDILLNINIDKCFLLKCK